MKKRYFTSKRVGKYCYSLRREREREREREEVRVKKKKSIGEKEREIATTRSENDYYGPS